MSIHLYFNYNNVILTRLTLNYLCDLNEAFGFLISEMVRMSVITLNDFCD